MATENNIAKCGNCGLEGDYAAVAEHAETCCTETLTETDTFKGEAVSLDIASTSEPTIVSVTHLLPEELDQTQAEKKVFIWNSTATNQLISMYAERKDAFSDRQVRKKRLWVEMAAELKKHGFEVTPAQVENKWKSLKGCYKRNKASMRRRRSEYTARQLGPKLAFFKSLEEVLQSEVSSGSDMDDASPPVSVVSTAPATTSSASTPPRTTTHLKPTIITLPSGSSVSPGALSDAFHPRIVTLVTNAAGAVTGAASRPRTGVTVTSDVSATEPGWFRSYREDCERRHQERLQLQREWMKQQKQLMGQIVEAFLQCKKCRHR